MALVMHSPALSQVRLASTAKERQAETPDGCSQRVHGSAVQGTICMAGGRLAFPETARRLAVFSTVKSIIHGDLFSDLSEALRVQAEPLGVAEKLVHDFPEFWRELVTL